MPDPLETFRETVAQALHHAERDPDLIRVRCLLRRVLNITDEALNARQEQ